MVLLERWRGGRLDWRGSWHLELGRIASNGLHRWESWSLVWETTYEGFMYMCIYISSRQCSLRKISPTSFCNHPQTFGEVQEFISTLYYIHWDI